MNARIADGAGVAGAIFAAGVVIFVHGPPAMAMIYGGAIVLVIAVIWSILARRARAAHRCE